MSQLSDGEREDWGVVIGLGWEGFIVIVEQIFDGWDSTNRVVLWRRNSLGRQVIVVKF